MKYGIELQLMREWQPRSRPTHGVVSIGEGPVSDPTVLVPGAAASGMEQMIITLSRGTRVDKLWATVQAFLQIDGNGFPGPRQGLVYLGTSDIWTGAIHFPRVALDGHPVLGGWHTLLMRITSEVKAR